MLITPVYHVHRVDGCPGGTHLWQRGQTKQLGRALGPKNMEAIS